MSFKLYSVGKRSVQKLWGFFPEDCNKITIESYSYISLLAYLSGVFFGFFFSRINSDFL